MSCKRRHRPEDNIQRAIVAHLTARAAPELWCHVPNGSFRPVEARESRRGSNMPAARPAMTAEAVAKALGGRKAGGGWTASCPAHDDQTPSLSIRDADDG